MTDNELIAEFIGFKSVEVPFDLGCKYLGVPPERQKQVAEESKKYFYEGNPYSPYASFYPKEMRFHYSWDWLMPVVEKIESMGHSVIISNSGFASAHAQYCNIMYGNTLDRLRTKAIGVSETKIEAVYKAVVDFIKWYNENKKV